MRQTCVRHASVIQVQACERPQLGDGLKPRLAYSRPYKLQHTQGSKPFQTLQTLVGKAAITECQFYQRGHSPNLDQALIANVGSGQIQMSELLEVLEFRNTVISDVRMV